MPLQLNYLSDANLVEWFDAGDNSTLAVNADGTGGTPLNGGAVGRVTGHTGNFYINGLIGTFTPTFPTLKLGAYNGHSSLATSSASLSLAGGASTVTGFTDAAGIGGSSFTIVVAYKCTGTANTLVAKSGAIGSQNIRVNMFPGYGVFKFFTGNSFYQCSDGGFHTVMWSADSTRGIVRAGFDGCGTYGNFTAPVALDTTHPLTIGSGWNGTATANYMNGEIFAVGFYSRYLLPWEYASLDDQLRDYYGFPRADASSPFICIFDGNSLTSINDYFTCINQALGLPSPPATTMPNQAATVSGSCSGGAHNCGWGSKTTSNQLTYGSDIDNLILYKSQQRPGVPIIVLQSEITNDLVGGATVVTACEHVVQYVEARKSALVANGVTNTVKFVVGDLLDRSNIAVAIKRSVNGWLAQAQPKFADALWSWQGDVYTSTITLTGDAYYTLNTINTSDSVHYQTGYPSTLFNTSAARNVWELAQTFVTLPAATAFTLADAIVPGASVYNVPGGFTYLWLMPNGTYTGTVTVSSGTAGDTWSSPDALFATGGSTSCTATYAGQARGCLLQLNFGGTTGTRTITVSGTGFTTVTRSVAVATTAATALACCGPLYNKNGYTYPWAVGVASPPYTIWAATATNTMNRAYQSTNVTVTVTPTNATVAYLNGQTIGPGGNAIQFTLTPTGAASAVSFTISNSGTLTNPTQMASGGGIFSSALASPFNATPTLSVTASPDPTGHLAMYATFPPVYQCLGHSSNVSITVTDTTGGGTVSPGVYTFTPQLYQVSQSVNAPLSSSATYTFHCTNTSALSNPGDTTVATAANSYTGLYALSGGGSTTVGVPIALTATPSLAVPADRIHWSDGGHGGTLSADTLFTGQSTATSVNYTNATPGTYPLTPTADFGGAFSPSTLTVTVGSSGTIVVIGFEGGISTGFDGGFVE